MGNFCIAGHNYRNSQLFSRIPQLEIGDLIYLTDLSGITIEYIINNKYSVSPEDTSCTSQTTNGKREITLITCTNSTLERIIVKAVER